MLDSPAFAEATADKRCWIHERASETSWNYGLGEIGKKKVVENGQKCALLSKNEAKIRKNARFLSKNW